MKIKFGSVTSSEIDVMLTASMESGDATAKSILDKCREVGRNRGYEYDLTPEEAKYLAGRLCEDADRVAEACGEAAGRAFETAGEKLAGMLRQTSGTESSAVNSSPRL
jgi:hypothetical protein